MKVAQEDWVSRWNGQNHHLKHHVQLKTKEAGGEVSVMGGYQENTINEGKGVLQI